ncbi:Lrp/AsnC family transcriptional regulator [Paraburkholderia sp. USG1]|uniref:Lrp/AsnC family transcriptional regulator n=1 Tax=Paraburkholderia sp. USG1 TaxID=2952268 RepID=UPI00285E58A7|nr:Lrp/AsnC family transcriptional regulator [Paraburkholderia sp. USG1]MDR8402129.1 Lrp/AsnC family transcriptional regulator [Paraburkholderia sp. USG1]
MLSQLLTDARNVELLKLLLADPRMSVSELARRLHVSAPTVRERLVRLEERGVIRRFVVELDPEALGLPVTVFIRIRPMSGQLGRIIELAQALPQVSECHRITGEDCFILKAHLAKLERLDELLDRFLAYGQTTTSIVQSSPVPARGLPLPDGRVR